MVGSGLIGVSSAAMVVGGGIGGSGLIGVSSVALVVGGGMGGSGLIGVSSAAMVVGGGIGGRGLIGVANAEEVMVAATKVLKITVQIFVLMDFVMGECSLVGRNALQRKGNPNGGGRLPQK